MLVCACIEGMVRSRRTAVSTNPMRCSSLMSVIADTAPLGLPRDGEAETDRLETPHALATTLHHNSVSVCDNICDEQRHEVHKVMVIKEGAPATIAGRWCQMCGLLV